MFTTGSVHISGMTCTEGETCQTCGGGRIASFELLLNFIGIDAAGSPFSNQHQTREVWICGDCGAAAGSQVPAAVADCMRWLIEGANTAAAGPERSERAC